MKRKSALEASPRRVLNPLHESTHSNDKEEAMEEEREPVVLKVTVPDPGRPDPANPDVPSSPPVFLTPNAHRLLLQMFLAKMPFYIGYEPYPFSKDTFLMEEGEDEEDVQLKVTNSIRWRPNPATVRSSLTSFSSWLCIAVL
jgi:hypothetical protein